jgi:hypothetical protein
MQSPPGPALVSRWGVNLCKGPFDSNRQRGLDGLRRLLRSPPPHVPIGEGRASDVPALHESKRPILVLAVDGDRMGAFHPAEPCPSPLHRVPAPVLSTGGARSTLKGRTFRHTPYQIEAV